MEFNARSPAPLSSENDKSPAAPASTLYGRTGEVDWSDATTAALCRVHDFVRSSLRETPPEVAAIDTSQALLLKALIQVDRALDEALGSTVDPIERFEGLASAVDLLLRLAQQIDRFGRLRLLLLEVRRTLPFKPTVSAPGEDSAT